LLNPNSLNKDFTMAALVSAIDTSLLDVDDLELLLFVQLSGIVGVNTGRFIGVRQI